MFTAAATSWPRYLISATLILVRMLSEFSQSYLFILENNKEVEPRRGRHIPDHIDQRMNKFYVGHFFGINYWIALPTEKKKEVNTAKDNFVNFKRIA